MFLQATLSVVPACRASARAARAVRVGGPAHASLFSGCPARPSPTASCRCPSPPLADRRPFPPHLPFPPHPHHPSVYPLFLAALSSPPLRCLAPLAAPSPLGLTPRERIYIPYMFFTSVPIGLPPPFAFPFCRGLAPAPVSLPPRFPLLTVHPSPPVSLLSPVILSPPALACFHPSVPSTHRSSFPPPPWPAFTPPSPPLTVHPFLRHHRALPMPPLLRPLHHGGGSPL